MAKQGEIDYLKNLGEEGISHALNKPFSDENCGLYLRDMGIIMSLLPPLPARILDMGVGSGWTSVFLAKRGYEVIGQDIAPDMIKLAKENKNRENLGNLSFITSDYEFLTFSNEFNAVLFYDCLHHCIDEGKAIETAYKALKAGGKLITAEPGTGHSTSETSIKAMEEYGVTEKDMPPKLIISYGKSCGFKKFEIFERHLTIAQLFPLSISFLKSFIRQILNRRGQQVQEQSNIVVLTK